MKYTPEDAKRICKLYLQGIDFSIISKEFNISGSTIGRILQNNNIKAKQTSESEKYNNIIKENEKEICDMYMGDMSANKISKIFKVHTERILKCLRENNIQIRSQSESLKIKLDLTTINKICEMYKNMIPASNIIKELCIPYSIIKRILRENNIKIRRIEDKTSHITSDIEKEICEIYKREELSLFNLGRKYNVSKDFIILIIKKNNISIRPSGKVTETGKKSIIESNKRRCGELSARFGSSPPKEHCWGIGCWYDSPLQGEIWIRSGWETRYAIFLDEHNILWTYETIAFPLILNSRKATYRPDFYLVDYDIYTDVKGRPEWNADKIQAFREQYTEIKLQVLFKEDLRNWGITLRKPIIINNKWRI